MPKPIDLPRWADVGGKIVEPPGAKKDVGWVAQEKLPEGFLNWLLNLIYQWIVYFEEVRVGEEVIVHASDVGGVVNCTYVNIFSGYWNVSAAPGEIHMPLQVSPGDIITDWTVDIRDTASTVSAVLLKAVAGVAPTTLGATQNSAGNTTDQTLSHTLASPETVVSGTYYWIRMSMPANNMRFYGGSYTRDLNA